MKNLYAVLFLISCLSFSANAQSIISGTIKDGETGEPLIGASVMVEGRMIGTTTDLDGFFTLTTKENPRFNITISLIGYRKKVIEIITNDQKVNTVLDPDFVRAEEVVVSASRVEESILQSPVTIERMDILEIRSTASASAYSALANLKGVQMNTSSLTFQSVNTRGFADVQNWRFVQLIDGVEMNAPGLNFPGGMLSAPSDIELSSIELVPGAGSALYGPNAFNGMLHIYTKNPFFYQGFSAEIKGGGTFQQGIDPNPYGEINVRYAKAFNDKFAFSISASALMVTDWTANSEEYHITNDLVAAGVADDFRNLPRSHPNFDAVHWYGDEVQVPVNLGGGVVQNVNRSGIPESDIVNYNQQIFKASAGLHYRINDDMELSYNFRFMHGDGVLRHTTTYPLVDLWQQVHKLELKGDNFFARAYYSGEDAGNSYQMLASGAYIQEGLKSSALWSADYGAAFRGEIEGVTAGDHEAARTYADRDIPGSDTEIFETLREQTLTNPNILEGGSRLVDRTSFAHGEVNYDFSKHWDLIPIQIGGSFRRYNLVSDGWLFNDGENGFNQPIGIIEYGAYVQASKKLFDDILSLQASARMDKNQNFQFRVTPRASVVVAWGKKRNHNFRLSYQTGFRNPANQETYSVIDVGQAVILGGVEDNISNYNYVTRDTNPITQAPPMTMISGTEIWDNLYTLSSTFQFQATGDPTVLDPLNINYLEQEEITTFEAGYKSLIANKLYIDAHGYYNIYTNFVTRINGYSTLANRVFSAYTNIDEQITSIGAGLGLEYALPLGFRLGANYSFAIFDADEAIAANPEFLPAFNTPNHRANASFSNRDVWNGIGFNIKYRWTEEYLWQSPFGQGLVPTSHVIDAAIFYRIPNVPIQLKLGANNITNQPYQQIYGGPMIGTQAFLSIMYDPVAFKGKVGGGRRGGGKNKSKNDDSKKRETKSYQRF